MSSGARRRMPRKLIVEGIITLISNEDLFSEDREYFNKTLIIPGRMGPGKDSLAGR